MGNIKAKTEEKKVDMKELELPETLYVRDIENKVFQGIILQCLSQVEGIALLEGTFIDNIFNKGALDGVKGIFAEQDNQSPSVKVKLEVNIHYGYSIPEKAEEIQNLCSQEITRLTGLHVSSVHVVFKNVLLDDFERDSVLGETPSHREKSIEEDYNDEF